MPEKKAGRKKRLVKWHANTPVECISVVSMKRISDIAKTVVPLAC